MSQEASTPPTGGARQARIDEAIASWLTPSTPPSANEKEKQPKEKDYKDNKEKDKNKEKGKDEEGKQPVAKDKRIMAAVSEWSGSAVAVKDVKKHDKKEKKEAKRREKEEKRREKEEKQKKESSAATPKQKKPFFRSSTAGRHESSTSIPTSSSNPQISALAAPEEPIDDTTPVPLRLDAVQYLLQLLRRLNGEFENSVHPPPPTSLPSSTQILTYVIVSFQ
jgi:hypothetical protein